MNQSSAMPPAQRLNEAWKKFSARVRAVRAKTTSLLATVDKQKQEHEVAELRKRIK